MSKIGTIIFKQEDRTSRFIYSYKISDYHAAKILEYIAQIPHKSANFRDSKGKFISAKKTSKL